MLVGLINQIANHFFSEPEPYWLGDKSVKPELIFGETNYSDYILPNERVILVNPLKFKQKFQHTNDKSRIVLTQPQNFEEFLKMIKILENYTNSKKIIFLSSFLIEFENSQSPNNARKLLRFIRERSERGVKLIFLDEPEKPLNYFGRLLREYLPPLQPGERGSGLA